MDQKKSELIKEKIYAQVIHAQGSAKKYMKMISKGNVGIIIRCLADLKERF